MQYGLVNYGGKQKIPQNILNMLNFPVYQDYSVDWMFYYNIELYNLEDINNLIDFFGGQISIELDPTTLNQFLIGVKLSCPEDDREGLPPF